MQPAPLAGLVSPATPPWRRLPLLFMRLALLLLIPNLLTAAQDTNALNLGAIYRLNWLTWDYPFAVETNVTHFRMYYAEPEVIPYQLHLLGDLREQRWPGTNSASGLNGEYVIGVTAVATLRLTNYSATNFTVITNLIESDPSLGLATFRDGVPVPPGNVQLFTVLQVMATNNLPAAPYSGASSLPVLPAMTSVRKGPEYELSGR